METNTINIFNQEPFNCKFDWGLKGTEEAIKRNDIIVIVDIFSFSTTITTAIHYGAIIYPYSKYELENIDLFAKSVGAEIVLGRAEASVLGKPSLSSLSFNESSKNKKYVLPSRNGSTYSKLANQNSRIIISSFVNASAVADVVNKIMNETNLSVTVIACGERWRESKELRPGIEDYLGAGIILDKLNGTKSPEAIVCINAYSNSKNHLEKLLWDCSSGRELRDWGFGDDVKYASKIDTLIEVPILKNDHFELYE